SIVANLVREKRWACSVLSFMDFAHRVEHGPAGVRSEEARVHRFGDENRWRQASVDDIQFEAINPLTVAACVGADVDGHQRAIWHGSTVDLVVLLRGSTDRSLGLQTFTRGHVV